MRESPRVPAETSLGAGGSAFPETAWSAILTCADAASPHRRARLDQLIATYWRPIYAFVRLAGSRSVEDAKDITQAFLAELIETDMVSRYEPERGRFRTFLKAALRHFLMNEHRDALRLKRGGGRIALDADALEKEGVLADRRQETPEQLFDRQWARDVIAHSLELLKEELATDQKESYLRVYESYTLQGMTYEEIARAEGLAVTDVRNYLNAVRERLRRHVRATVRDYVASQDELLLELREILSE